MAMKRGWVEISCPQRAASLVVRRKDLNTPLGKLVGLITDNTLAGMLGIASTYGLAVSGKNNALLKGILSGPPGWLVLSGLASVMGVTNPKLSAQTVLNKFIITGIHGAAANYLVMKLSAPEVFTDDIALAGASIQDKGTSPGKSGIRP